MSPPTEDLEKLKKQSSPKPPRHKANRARLSPHAKATLLQKHIRRFIQQKKF